jgi:hypothetical protein
MPIKDLSEVTRLPRLGKIHLGTRHPEKGYPMKADHFIFPVDHPDYKKLVDLFGKTPKELNILIPVEDDETWSSQYYKAYNQTYGLICKGDGEMATRLVDVKTNEFPDSKKQVTTTLLERPCLGHDCPEYKTKKCHEVMNFRFIIPEVPGLGVWQIDTGSKNSILNINSCARLIKRAFGRISMVPLKLTFESAQVNNPENGKKQTVYVLNLRTDITITQLANAAREQSKMFQLEAPDLESAFELEVEKDIKELWPEDNKPVKLEPLPEEPQQESAPAEIESSITPPEEPAKPYIDEVWLQESLKKLKWSVSKYLNEKYGVTGNTIREAVAKLTKEQAGEFTLEIQERLGMMV